MKYDQKGFYMVIASVIVAVCSHFNIIVGQSEALNIIVAFVTLWGTIRQALIAKQNAVAGGYHPSLTK